MKRSTFKIAGQLTLGALIAGSLQINGYSTAYAQSGRPIAGVAGLGNTVTIAPGTFEHIDIKADAFLSVFEKMNAQDSAWMRDAVTEINAAIDQLKTTQIRMVQLSNDSMQQPLGMELKQYLNAVSPVRIELQALKTKIDVLTAVPSARNANNVAKLESGKMTVAAQGAMQSIDISKIAKIMDEKLKNVEASINEITFYIRALNMSATATSPRIPQKVGDLLDKALLKNFTPEQINQLTYDAQKVESKAKNTLVIENDHSSKQNVRVLRTVIDEYGVKDRFEIRKNDVAGLEAARASIRDMYFARSVLRYVFAVPVGAFGTPDTRRMFSFQQVPLINSNKIEISDGIILDKSELTAKRRWIFAALETQKDWAGLNNGTGLVERLKNPLSNLSNLINFVSFREGWSKINAFVLQNMMNEIEEELMMAEPGGLLAVKTLIKERIAATADPKDASKLAATKAKIAEMIAVVKTADGQVIEGSAIGAGGTNDTLKTVATSVKRYLTTLNSANALRKQAADLRADSDAYAKGQSTRGNDLLE